MQCEFCQQQEATVFYKQACNGQVRQVHVCAACAAKNGISVETPTLLTDFLFGVSPAPARPPVSERACPGCRQRPAEFQKTGRLGCSRCYEEFAPELETVLTDMHRRTEHHGKVPEAQRLPVQLAACRRALDRAVAAQEYEQAAQLRDQIRMLESQCQSPEAAAAEKSP